MQPSYFWEVHTERIHIQAVQETRKTLAETRQALMHQLEVHEVGLQVGHGVCEFRKLRLEGIDCWLRVAGIVDTAAITMCFTKGRARAGSQGGRGPGGRSWAR